jgi:hypothetical protein
VLRRATALRRAHHALAMSWATCCGRRVGRIAALEISGPPGLKKGSFEKKRIFLNPSCPIALKEFYLE